MKKEKHDKIMAEAKRKAFEELDIAIVDEIETTPEGYYVKAVIWVRKEEV